VDAVLVGACTYHAAAVLAFNLPGNSPFGDELVAPFRGYVARAGLWQNWSMFHTIPYFSALGPKLLALGRDGAPHEHPPVLPGLAPYRPINRLSALFLRYTFPSDELTPHMHAYLRRACDEVQRATGERPVAMSLRLYSRRILPLAEVRARGSIARGAFDDAPLHEPCP
jgi:hypothetical protein